jgi:UDP-N-acetylglucosamine 1-carboxyvinyltransferase
MAAVAARGTTVLRNAACEPHVQDLAQFLVGCGARIDGIGTNTVTVDGGAPLGAAAYTIGPDYIEIGSFIGLAAVTNGAITMEGVRASDLRATLLAFERLGVRPRLDGTQLIVDADQERRIRTDSAVTFKLEDGPHGVSGRSHVHRHRSPRSAMGCCSYREDVRVPAVFRRR